MLPILTSNIIFFRARHANLRRPITTTLRPAGLYPPNLGGEQCASGSFWLLAFGFWLKPVLGGCPILCRFIAKGGFHIRSSRQPSAVVQYELSSRALRLQLAQPSRGTCFSNLLLREARLSTASPPW